MNLIWPLTFLNVNLRGKFLSRQSSLQNTQPPPIMLTDSSSSKAIDLCMWSLGTSKETVWTSGGSTILFRLVQWRLIMNISYVMRELLTEPCGVRHSGSSGAQNERGKVGSSGQNYNSVNLVDYCQQIIKPKSMQTQVRSLIKLTIIKLRQYNDMGALNQQELKRFLHSSQSLDASVTKILSIDVKNDYQHLIIMTFVNEIISIFMVFPEQTKHIVTKVETLLENRIVELIEYSKLGKEVGNYYYLKKMETLKLVFEYKLSLQSVNLPYFSKLYSTLKNCLITESNTTKEHYKISFVNIHRQIVTHCTDHHILEYLFNELVNDSLWSVENYKKDEVQALRLIDSRLLSLLTYLGQNRITERQLAQITYLLVKASAIPNSYVMGLVLSVSEAVLALLVNISSPLTIIIVYHTVINPLLEAITKPAYNIHLALLLGQLEYIFKHKRVLFSILNLTDLNAHAQPLVESLVTNLYAFVDEEEKKPVKSGAYEAVDASLKEIMASVKAMLDNKKTGQLSAENQKLYQFYQLKRKEYRSMVDKFNKEPKSIIKGELSDYQLQKLAHFLRRSPSINVQKMIECLGQPTPTSGQLLRAYLSSFNFKKFNTEESLRVMLSNFFLIGESQQINRVSEQLSKNLYENDQQKMESEDNVYVFCSAVLILNTDLHNPMNQHKMTEAGWVKMCSVVKGLTEQELLVIYQSVSKNKIQNFRDIKNLYKINYTCFMYNFYQEKQLWHLAYIDPELKGLESNHALFNQMAYESLEAILVSKKTTKLDKLVDSWVYREDVYECEILQLLKTLVSRGQQYVPERVVARILENVDFGLEEVNSKSLSYYWLICKVIMQHPSCVPTEVMCHTINSTYMIRLRLEDDLCCRELMKVKKIKDSVRWMKSKAIKKKGSILDIFANFLGDKESSNQEGLKTSSIKNPIAFKKLGAEVYELLGATKEGRIASVQYFMDKIRDSKNRVPVGQFIFTLYLIFDLVCSAEDIQCLRLIETFLNELLIDQDSDLGKRLKQLQKRKQKKYQLIVFMARYYALKILLEHPFDQMKTAGIVEQALGAIGACNLDLLREFSTKIRSLKLALGANYKSNQLIYAVEQAVIKNVNDNGYKDSQFKEGFSDQPFAQGEPIAAQVSQLPEVGVDDQKQSVDMIPRALTAPQVMGQLPSSEQDRKDKDQILVVSQLIGQDGLEKNEQLKIPSSQPTQIAVDDGQPINKQLGQSSLGVDMQLEQLSRQHQSLDNQQCRDSSDNRENQIPEQLNPNPKSAQHVHPQEDSSPPSPALGNEQVPQDVAICNEEQEYKTEEDLLLAEQQQLNRLMQEVSEEKLQRLGLSIYML